MDPEGSSFPVQKGSLSHHTMVLKHKQMLKWCCVLFAQTDKFVSMMSYSSTVLLLMGLSFLDLLTALSVLSSTKYFNTDNTRFLIVHKISLKRKRNGTKTRSHLRYGMILMRSQFSPDWLQCWTRKLRRSR